MSASSLPTGRLSSRPGTAVRSDAATFSAWTLLKACGSLKITVVMFFLAILLVLFGTLAQDEQNLSEVKALYFNSFLAIVPFDVLLPITIFPHSEPLPYSFPFPGGATIGLILMVNLVAAKLTRFHVAAKGTKLVVGTLVSLLGAGIVVAVIIAGNATEGLQGKPPISYESLWYLLKGGIYLLAVGAVVAAMLRRDLPSLARISLWVIASLMVCLSAFLLFSGESVRLDDPGLRIVWQLLQSSVAAMVVLVGLWMVFGNRGGNVLIHVGVALMMLGQFIFGDRQVEQRMSLAEGQQTNLVYSQNELELALIDTSDPREDKVTAIPERLLQRAAARKQVIDAAELPCKLKVLKWMPNSTVVDAKEGQENPTTTGIGLRAVALPERTNGGASSKIDIASAYVEVIDKKTDQSLGVYLLSQVFNDQRQLFMGAPPDQNESLTIDGKAYSMALRFRREYKPYQVFLEDVERENYAVSDRARDFSSHVVIRDPRDGTELKGHIWMNNPVRYRGETFYQSEYNSMRQNGQVIETTGLQVVANQGWVIPYVACMLVLFGMLSHFIGVFFRFANRFERGAIPTAESIGLQKATSTRRLWLTVGPLAALIVVMMGYAAKPPKVSDAEIDWYAVGQIPAMHEGRPKPLDTVARNVLQQIGEPLFGATPRPKDVSSGQRRSGTAWLVSLMADKKWPADAPVFRVYSQEARDFFGLKPKAGYLYSYNELAPKADELRERLKNLPQGEKLSAEDEKLAHILRKLQLYDTIAFSYRLPPLPDESQFKDTEEDRRRFGSQLMNLMEYERQLEASNPPAVIPPEPAESGQAIADDKWQAYSPAIFTSYVTQKLGMRTGGANPAILKFTDVLDAVRDNDSQKLNRAVEDYRAYVSSLPNVEKKISGVPVEAWLNHFSPTTWGVALYLVAFTVGMIGMLSFSPVVRWSTFTIIVLTLAIHTIAIVSRIYVSGRPPVVNLYSSAVFIGWASVLFALVLELIYPLGICNLAAALIGASTLSIARSLDSSDTMHVLEAVLDTQFWLSTHVITVTLGYGATFLAGLFGIIALVHRMTSGIDRKTGPEISPKDKDDLNVQTMLTRIIYGVLCFAILFSFIGTVLGGLWADDSWGRFWGWDPKENGALMIVLWNALVLHANWDRMVGGRGLAVLAVLGNIVTSWSWFGTNQLGIGLHSYGFTSAVLVTLALVVVGHVGFVIVSLMLTRPKMPAAGLR